MSDSDITTATIDQQVQATLKDWRVSPFKRAHLALELIENHILTEHGVDVSHAPVPLEWEHRVAGMAEVERAHVGGPPFIEGEVVSDTDDEIKEAFDALHDGEEEKAQARFNKWWNRGTP